MPKLRNGSGLRWKTDRKGLAAELNVSVRTVGYWIERGWIPSFKVGGFRRFDPDAVRTALEKRKVKEVVK
jgi:excisionase family DNA binding protein